MTITIIAPIYLVLQLLCNCWPIDDSALIDEVDLSVFPSASFIGFVIPTLGLGFPLVGGLSQIKNYVAIALWQPFPLYQSAAHFGLRALFGRAQRKESVANATPPSREYRHRLNNAYGFILRTVVAVHCAVFAVILTSWATNLLPEILPATFLLPESILQPPTLPLTNGSQLTITASKTIVVSFLMWDVYCTCLAFVSWAAYLIYDSRKPKMPIEIILKGIWWFALGGPIAPAIAMVWERDLALLGDITETQDCKKSV